MKKLILILGLSLMATGAFAGNSEKEKSNEKKENVQSVCCRRGQTLESGENVSVRACVPSTGDYAIDMGHACEKAIKMVKAAIAAAE